jgi:hypothetical protein
MMNLVAAAGHIDRDDHAAAALQHGGGPCTCTAA